MQRRTFLKGLGLAGLSLSATGQAARAAAAPSDAVYLYVGAWNGHGGNPGLYLTQFDQTTGKITPVKRINDAIACGWIYIDRRPNGVFLHCTDETDLPLGLHRAGGGGRVYSYRVNPANGDLTQVNIEPSYGGDPSMVWVDPTGRYLTCCHHTAFGDVCLTEKTRDGKYRIVSKGPDANLVLFPLRSDGKVADPHDIVTFPDGSALHGCVWEPRGRFFVVPDIAHAKVYSYKIDYAAKRLERTAGPWDDAPGSAPRYVKFHPISPWMFLNHENSSTKDSWVIAFRFDGRGKLSKINEARAVPPTWQPRVAPGASFQQQDLKIDAKGQYLYSVYRAGLDVLGSNGKQSYVKGFDGVAVFEINQQTGALTNIQSLNLDLEWARGCAISPNGKWLVVSALYSSEVITLAIGSDGRLTQTGKRASINTASSLTFYTPGTYPIDGVTGGFY